jgi:hypothetical protein
MEFLSLADQLRIVTKTEKLHAEDSKEAKSFDTEDTEDTEENNSLTSSESNAAWIPACAWMTALKHS